MKNRAILRDRDRLRWFMSNPQRGRPYTIRELATAAGLGHHSVLGHLLTGERDGCSEDDAKRIAEAVGAAFNALFMPAVSTHPNETVPAETTPT